MLDYEDCLECCDSALAAADRSIAASARDEYFMADLEFWSAFFQLEEARAWFEKQSVAPTLHGALHESVYERYDACRLRIKDTESRVTQARKALNSRPSRRQGGTTAANPATPSPPSSSSR